MVDRRHPSPLNEGCSTTLLCMHRWRKLPGKVPGTDDVHARISYLHERLNQANAIRVSQLYTCNYPDAHPMPSRFSLIG